MEYGSTTIVRNGQIVRLSGFGRWYEAGGATEFRIHILKKEEQWDAATKRWTLLWRDSRR